MTKKEIDRAKKALQVQEYLGWPSVEEYLDIVRGNEIRNCDVTVDDIKRMLKLFGVPTAYIRGRMTRRKPLKHDPLENLQEPLPVELDDKRVEQEPLPVELDDKRVELFIDLFKFASIYFMLQESSRIKYVQIDDIESQTMASLIPLVIREIAKYTARGLKVTGVHYQLFFEF